MGAETAAEKERREGIEGASMRERGRREERERGERERERERERCIRNWTESV